MPNQSTTGERVAANLFCEIMWGKEVKWVRCSFPPSRGRMNSVNSHRIKGGGSNPRPKKLRSEKPNTFKFKLQSLSEVNTLNDPT